MGQGTLLQLFEGAPYDDSAMYPYFEALSLLLVRFPINLPFPRRRSKSLTIFYQISILPLSMN